MRSPKHKQLGDVNSVKAKKPAKREPFRRWSCEEGTLFFDGVGLWQAQLNRAMDIAVSALNAARVVLPARRERG